MTAEPELKIWEWVALIASCLILVAIPAVLIHYTSFEEVFVPTLLAIGGAYLLWKCCKSRWPKTAKWCAVGIATLILTPHFFMAIELRPVRTAFKDTVHREKPVYEWKSAKDLEARNTLDYHRKLDELLVIRDADLHQHHFIGLGSWRVYNDEGTAFAMYYLYWPFQR